MKVMKNYKIIFTTLTVILFVLLTMTCISHFEEEMLQIPREEKPGYTPPAGMGTVLLKFSDNARSTIFPSNDVKFDIIISFAGDDGIIVKEIKGKSIADAEAPIDLLAGRSYSILVLGYGEVRERHVFEGKAENVTIKAGEPESVNIDMKLVFDEGGTGTFTYDITVPDAGNACLDIYKMNNSNLKHKDLNTPPSTTTGEYELEAGYYIVEISVGGKTGYNEYALTWVIHIYPDMTSDLTYTMPSLRKVSNIKVTFNAKEGLFKTGNPTMEKIVPETGNPVAEPSGDDIPILYGEKVEYWTRGLNGARWDFSDMVWSDLELFAKWETKPLVTVTYHANGGTPSPATPQSIPEGEKIPEPSAMTKTGHTFDGWYTEPAFTTIWNFATNTVVGDTDLYAKWTANPCTVTFNANGGAPQPQNQIVAYGGKVTQPSAMTKTGHTFDGWYKESTFTTPWNFTTDTVTGNMTLYAKWTIITCTVTFHSNPPSGDNNDVDNMPVINPVTVDHGGQIFEPPQHPTTSLENYTFEGWRNGLAGDLCNFPLTVTSNLDLYAYWKKGEEKEVTGDIDVDNDGEYVVIIGKDAWQHGFRIQLSNSFKVNAGPPFKWSITVPGHPEEPVYVYPWDDGSFRLPGLGDQESSWTPQRPHNMEWYLARGYNPIVVTVEYEDRTSTSNPKERKTLTFIITFREEYD